MILGRRITAGNRLELDKEYYQESTKEIVKIKSVIKTMTKGLNNKKTLIELENGKLIIMKDLIEIKGE